jgi:tight adherence protein C
MHTMAQTTTIIFIGLSIGLSIGLIAWTLARTIEAIPAEDRQYKDDPPLGFRLMWHPIQWLSHFIAPLIGAKSHRQMQEQLQQAGMDYTLSPAQIHSARLWCGLIVAMLAGWTTYTLTHINPGATTNNNTTLQAMVVGLLMGYLYPKLWLSDIIKRRKTELIKALPFYLDIITLCIEAGLNMQSAIQQAVGKGPKGVLRDEFQRVLRDIRAGKTRADSLRAMATRLGENSISSFCSAVIQAESMGMNLGPMLRAQADQRRSERFLRAEKLAMEAPVKMLFPLIAFIFPCTFIVLFFPIVMKFMHSGI